MARRWHSRISPWLAAAGLALAVGGLASLSGCAGRPAEVLSTPDQPALPDVQQAADGSYQWQDQDWLDVRRERAVPVRVYWPTGAAPRQGWPVILFSHGMGGSRRGYSYLGSYWASQGFMAVHVQHVGSDRRLWGGNRLALVLRLQQAARAEEAIDRTQDMRYALDQLLQSPWGAQVDKTRIVAAGHSYGANTSLLLAGARVAEPERLLRGHATLPTLQDERIRAAIVISAPPFYGEGDPAPIVGPIRIPTLHISATADEINIPGYYSDARDRIQLFDATGGPHKALALFEGGSHSIFTDRAGTGGVALNPRVKAATRELSLAYLRLVLDGQPQALEQWRQRHAGLLARWQAP